MIALAVPHKATQRKMDFDFFKARRFDKDALQLKMNMRRQVKMSFPRAQRSIRDMHSKEGKAR